MTTHDLKVTALAGVSPLAMLDAAPDATLLVDAEGRILHANARADDLFGWPGGALHGESVDVLVPAEHRGGHAGLRAGFLRASEARPMGSGRTLHAVRRDGSRVPVEISLSPLRGDGQPLVLVAVRDVSWHVEARALLERQKAALARSNAELEQFAYVASHDLQEPLRMVGSYSGLLARRYRGKLDDDADDFIHFIVDGAQRMQVLINDLLSWSRLGRRPGHVTSAPLDRVLDRVLADLQGAIQESGATIERAPLPEWQVDARQLAQLLLNLVSNAIKFRGASPPQVQIGAREHADHLELWVQDDGIGIAPAHQERIFQIFQRLHGRGEYPGTGIGLAICQRVAVRHGGELTVASAPGQGARFTLTLPRQPPQLPEEP